MKTKRKQVKWNIPTGMNGEGKILLERWKRAALKVQGDPKQFNAWIRKTLNLAADKVLGKKR